MFFIFIVVLCTFDFSILLRVLKYFSSSDVSKEFEKNRCSTDYHGACKTSWKNCNLRGSQIFCHRSCGSKKSECQSST